MIEVAVPETLSCHHSPEDASFHEVLKFACNLLCNRSKGRLFKLGRNEGRPGALVVIPLAQ